MFTSFDLLPGAGRRMVRMNQGSRAFAGNKSGLSRGLSMIELLMVLAIMAIIIGALLFAVPGLKGSRDLVKSSDDVQGILEQARTMAMADNTYVWVGFFEENPNSPGTAGTGQVVVSVVASSDGTQLFKNSSPPTNLPATSLTQVLKLIKLPNLHLDILSATDVPRAAIPVNTYQLGSSSFSNNIYFSYPLSGSQYKFYNIIQFNPQGDATRIGDSPTQLMEIGMRPAKGATALANSKNLIAIQIAGISGRVIAYRP